MKLATRRVVVSSFSGRVCDALILSRHSSPFIIPALHPPDFNPTLFLSFSPPPLLSLFLFRIGAGIFGQVLRSMPRGRRFRVPPSAQRSSFDPFAVQAACAQGATPRKGSLVRPRRRPRNIRPVLTSPSFSFGDFTASKTKVILFK